MHVHRKCHGFVHCFFGFTELHRNIVMVSPYTFGNPAADGTDHETWRGTRSSRDDRFEPIKDFWFNILSEMNRPVRQSEQIHRRRNFN